MLKLPNTTSDLSDSPVTVTILVLETLVLLWILIANFLLWIVLRVTAAFHIPLNYILASLILANYLFAASSLPFEIINLGLVFNWRFGQGLCELWHGCDVISRTAFPWLLLMLSIERWVFCRHRTWYNSRKKTDAVIGIACTWIFVILLSGGAFIAIGRPNFDDSRDYNACYWSDDVWTYALYHAASSFFVPVFVALLLYLILVCWLGARSGREVAPSTRPPTAQPVSRGATSIWSDMSLPTSPVPPSDTQLPTSTRPSSTHTTRHIGLELEPVVTNRIAPLDPVIEPIEAWGGSVPPTEFKWDEILFNKMLMKKPIRTPTAKPVLNEDLIKTLPPARNPRLLPKLERQPSTNLPPLEIQAAEKDLIQKENLNPDENKPNGDVKQDPKDKSADNKTSTTGSPKAQKRPSQSSAGPGRDSGFGSNSAVSDKKNAGGQDRRGSKWSMFSTHGGNAVLPASDHDESDDSIVEELAPTITPSLKLNSIKWLWVLFVVYVVCWCPFYAVYLVLAGTNSTTFTWEVYAACRLVGALNSALNPLVLLLVVRQYRQALGYLLRLRDPNTLYAHMQADWDMDDDDDDEGEEEEDDKKSTATSRYAVQSENETDTETKESPA